MSANKLFLLLCSAVMMLGAKAYSQDSSSSSDDHSVVGSFIGQRGTTVDDPVLDQYIFSKDHTAYHFQSTALIFPITRGTFAPDVGTWKICDDRLIATFIGFTALPECAPCCCDINISKWSRATHELEIIDCNTLRVVHRVFRDFTFEEDPLFDDGEVVHDSTAEFDLRRVPVRPSDLGDDVPCDCVTSAQSCSSSSDCSSSSSSSSTSTCEESAHNAVKKPVHNAVKKPARKNVKQVAHKRR